MSALFVSFLRHHFAFATLLRMVVLSIAVSSGLRGGGSEGEAGNGPPLIPHAESESRKVDITRCSRTKQTSQPDRPNNENPPYVGANHCFYYHTNGTATGPPVALNTPALPVVVVYRCIRRRVVWGHAFIVLILLTVKLLLFGCSALSSVFYETFTNVCSTKPRCLAPHVFVRLFLPLYFLPFDTFTVLNVASANATTTMDSVFESCLFCATSSV